MHNNRNDSLNTNNNISRTSTSLGVAIRSRQLGGPVRHPKCLAFLHSFFHTLITVVTLRKWTLEGT